MKNALHLNRTADVYNLRVPHDLLTLSTSAANIKIPAPVYADAVHRAVDAVGTKDFDKVVKAEQEALARHSTQFVNDVKKAAAARVEAEYAARVDDLFDLFEPVLSANVETLNAKARSLPQHINRAKAMDAPLSVIATMREVEEAWSIVEHIASALKPYFRGHGNHGARFAPLLVSVLPQPDTLAEAVEIRKAMDGKWEGMGTAYATTYTTLSILPPPALAHLGVTFEVASPSDYPQRVRMLDHITTPKTYREEYDDAAVFEPNAKPRPLVL